jgi:Icc-related predicted phosphoesterase
MNKKFKIWHISDTHTYHDLLQIPEGIDMVIHSGDCSNPRDSVVSKMEILAFIDWFAALPIKHKVFVAGNHDVAIERSLITRYHFIGKDIVYLENESITIDGINIWGSPFTPSFGEGWAFNKKRDKLHNVWATIPDDTNIVITHGPPMGILDLSYSRENILEFCGCNALKKRMLQLQPELCLFGHIHNCQDIINAGTTKLSAYETIYSNGSVVTDGKFGKLSSNGNILEI